MDKIAEQNKVLGNQGEDWATKEYKKRGYKIIGRNIKITSHKQLGEIDIIAVKGKELVFIEVKTRTDNTFMPSIEAVSWRKRQKLMRAIKSFWVSNPKYKNYYLRADAVIIQSNLDGKIQSANIIEDVIQDLS